MSRKARIKYDEAIYHIYTRGHNKEDIFICDNDRAKFLQILSKYKEKYNIKIYTYCLMTNHFHIIIDANGQDISRVMHGINLSYAMYINKKYSHCGSVFQDRFKSEIIKSDEYLMACSRYIHKNPVRAQISDRIDKYKWSSFNIFTGQSKDTYDIVETDFILQLFSNNKKTAINEYILFVEEFNDDIAVKVEMAVYENTNRRAPLKAYKVEDVLAGISRIFDMPEQDILRKSSRASNVAKKYAMYIINIKSRLNQRQIAKLFDIAPSGVSYSINKCIQHLKTNSLFKQKTEMLYSYLQ